VLSQFGPGPSLWAALVVAVLFTGCFVMARLNYLRIPKLGNDLSASGDPDCMVVIPARNEASTIAQAVASFPHDTVIVVDDRSTDATADIARSAGAGVIQAPELPLRAIGKVNACAAGARVLTSRWILFVDADTSYDVRFLRAAVAFAEGGALDFLSIHLLPRCETVLEHILVPYWWALSYCGVRAQDPAAAFQGQCVLVRRQAYEFIGGHSAILTEVVDDAKLAALAKRHRLKIGVTRSGRLGSVRFHADGLRRGFQRDAIRFMMVNPWMRVALIVAATSTALWLPAVLWLRIAGYPEAGLILALLPTFVLGIWYGNPGWALLAPLAIYSMAPIIWSGAIGAFTGRQIEWKGRII
jgi:chlorobactene glucosyltransferase